MVDYQLVPVGNQYQYMDATHRWAEADTEQAAGYLRRLYEDEAYYREKAEAGREWIATRFSPEKTAEKIRKRLEEIGALSKDAGLAAR